MAGTLVNHVGLTVGDLRASTRFYTEVVGMTLELDGITTGGDWFDTLTDNRGAVIDVALLRAGSLVLQLVEYRRAGDPGTGAGAGSGAGAGRTTGHNRVGNVHLSINVDDLDAKHASVRAAGGCRPTPIVELPFGGLRSFYVRDPDGVPVEFIEDASR